MRNASDVCFILFCQVGIVAINVIADDPSRERADLPPHFSHYAAEVNHTYKLILLILTFPPKGKSDKHTAFVSTLLERRQSACKPRSITVGKSEQVQRSEKIVQKH